jgi:hypothetical protein
MLFTFSRDFLDTFAKKRQKVNKMNNVPKIVDNPENEQSPQNRDLLS